MTARKVGLAAVVVVVRADSGAGVIRNAAGARVARRNDPCASD
jgi:hypothetical protein